MKHLSQNLFVRQSIWSFSQKFFWEWNVSEELARTIRDLRSRVADSFRRRMTLRATNGSDPEIRSLRSLYVKFALRKNSLEIPRMEYQRAHLFGTSYVVHDIRFLFHWRRGTTFRVRLFSYLRLYSRSCVEPFPSFTYAEFTFLFCPYPVIYRNRVSLASHPRGHARTLGSGWFGWQALVSTNPPPPTERWYLPNKIERDDGCLYFSLVNWLVQVARTPRTSPLLFVG